MAQQAKDIYSGIKKIFPSSRRSSGSFSFSGRSSSTASAAPNLFGPDGDELSAAALAAVPQDADRPKERKKKERRPSFSFSSWGKDKHRTSSSASGPPSGPGGGGPGGPVPSRADAGQVVMSLPYGAQAATPKGYVSPSHLTDYANQNDNPNGPAPARGSLYNEPSAAVTSASSRSSAHRSSAGVRSSAHRSSANGAGPQPHGFSSSSLEPPKLGGRSVSVDLTSRASAGGRPDARAASASAALLQYTSGPVSSSGLRGSRRSRHSTSSLSNITAQSSGPLADAVRASAASGVHGSSVRSFSSSVRELAAPTALELAPEPVAAAPVKRRDSLAVYRHNMAVAAGSSADPVGRASLGGPPPASTSNSALLTPEKPKKKKERRTSLSFTSSRKKQAEAAAALAAAATAASSSQSKPSVVAAKPSTAAAKPHASTWDSDSDDDYEDSKRPTRGLDRRSQSMDFMEQAPTHLISKLWRKLPIQARLIGGRGSIDLDLQKDRNSFSRSSTAKQQLREYEQQQQQSGGRGSMTRRPPSPVPDESNVFGDKRIRFSHRLVLFFDESDAHTAALESYDDVLVRVCKFAAHDKRRTATKVQEFLERSMAFLHGTRTKHGNVVSISNEEIRMWRRLALHDWALEEPTPPMTMAVETKVGKKDKRSSSSVSTAGSDDSDEPSGSSRPRPPAIGTMSEERTQQEEDVRGEEENEEENEEEDEEEDEEDLKLPRRLDLSPLREVVNCCVGFGERVFSVEELDDLVRLEFLVEEDGWI